MEYKDKTFGEGERAELDGNSFDGCTFGTGSTVVLSGAAPTQINNCRFERPQIEIRDAAGNTLSFLRGLFASGEGGRGLVAYLLGAQVTPQQTN